MQLPLPGPPATHTFCPPTHSPELRHCAGAVCHGGQVLAAQRGIKARHHPVVQYIAVQLQLLGSILDSALRV